MATAGTTGIPIAGMIVAFIVAVNIWRWRRSVNAGNYEGETKEEKSKRFKRNLILVAAVFAIYLIAVLMFWLFP